jgi:hypothetical protein
MNPQNPSALWPSGFGRADVTSGTQFCPLPADIVAKVAGLKIFCENTKQRAVADSYDLNRVLEVACEFCVRP